MQYNHLKSIVAARKQEIALETPSKSFFLPLDRPRPYIEPTFSKIHFPNESPSIIFVQAIGASGKTTTACALSYDLKIPHGLVHPLARYVSRRMGSPGDLEDDELRVRFLRLKRILSEFAARKRGSLAKAKIENRRVLRNDVSNVGERVLHALKTNRVVVLDGHLYRLDMDACSKVLGVSWQQLRKGETSSPKLRDFLASIA